MQITQALILAGGLGTRFRRVREDVPKALAPIGGRAILDRQLEGLALAGVGRALLCLGHRADEFDDHLRGASPQGILIESLREPEPLGTAGAIAFARDALAAEDFFVMNGDTLVSELDYAMLAGCHARQAATATLTLAPAPANAASGGVDFNEQTHRVESFREKDAGQKALWTNAGVYVFSPRVFSYLPLKGSLEYELFPALLHQGEPVAGYVHDGFVGDIGTPRGYRRVEEYLQEREKSG